MKYARKRTLAHGVLDMLSADKTAQDEVFDKLSDEEEYDAYYQVTRFKIRLLHELLQNSLTKRQKCYIMLYYRDRLTMEEIALKMGVNRSTVSRTLKASRMKLYRLVRDSFLD